MTTLCKQTVNVIKRIVETGKIFDIEVFIIDRRGIRAKSDKSYIFLSEENNFDFLEFDSLCINKISELNARLNFIEKIGNKDGYDIEVSGLKELDSGDTTVSKLRFLTDSTAIEVGCANAARYKLPWNINEPTLVTFDINHNSAEVLNGFSRSIQNKYRSINIKGIDEVIIATSTDDSGDTGTHVITTNPQFSDEKKDFLFTFNIGYLLSMLRGRLHTQCTLSMRGVLMTEINDLKIMILPEKNTFVESSTTE